MKPLKLIAAALCFVFFSSSAFAAGTVVYQGGTGTQVWPFTVTFSGLVSRTLIGGTGTTSTLTLQSTSGVGTTGADIIFKVGNNGATEAARILNNSKFGVGTPTPVGTFHAASNAPAMIGLSQLDGGVDQKNWYLDAEGDALYFGASNDSNNAGTNYIKVGRSGYNITQLDFLANLTPPAMTIKNTGNVGIGATSPASLLDLRAGDLTFSGANGQKYVQGRATELVSVGSGLTTKATTIQIPADAIVYAVPVRVITQPGGTTTMTVTATISATAFQKGANISTAAGTTDPGTKNTPVNYNSVAAQTITFTFNVATTDALGQIRVDIYYATSTPPTS